MIDPMHFANIDSMLEREDSQDIADAIVDIVEQYASDINQLEQLVDRYQARTHSSLQRVLTFYLARNAASLAGARCELIYRLVPTVISTGDISALTNAMTTVQRLAMWSVPWSHEEGNPPPELIELVLAGLRGTARNVADALDLLESFADNGILPLVLPPDRPRLADTLARAAPSLGRKLPGALEDYVARWSTREPNESSTLPAAEQATGPDTA